MRYLKPLYNYSNLDWCASSCVMTLHVTVTRTLYKGHRNKEMTASTRFKAAALGAPRRWGEGTQRLVPLSRGTRVTSSNPRRSPSFRGTPAASNINATGNEYQLAPTENRRPWCETSGTLRGATPGVDKIPLD